jgi:hypothetical protein
MADVDSIVKRNEALKSDRMPFMAFWQDVANYVMPRKSEILSQRMYPDQSKEQRLFDSTAIRANQILSNGHMSWITPQGQAWFTFDCPDNLLQSDEAKQWFAACTEIARRELARSNFYTEAHEFYLDRGGFGTACMFVAEGKKNALNFEAWELGRYSLCEDDEGRIDTCYRDFDMTLRQMALKFGKENLHKEQQDKLDSNDAHALEEKITIVHAIYSRDPSEYDPRLRDGKNMPVASCYVDSKNKHLLSEGGFNETPFMASRFLHWSKSVYGWSPSWMALPEARQLNFLEKQMDALAEIAAFPRILLPEGFAGSVDLRAHGVTYFDHSQPNAIPKEWITGGRYDIGKDRAEVRRAAIEKAFYVDVFQMFANIERQMTAREVAERSAEKLDQFSPSFSRLTVEFLNPVLQRVFSILLRGGHFPPPPNEVLMPTAAGAVIPEPKVNYSSRIALAIKALESAGFERTLEMWTPMIQARPEILDNLDLDTAFRDSTRNNNVPARWLMDSRKMAQVRAQRAQQQAQQQQIEQAQQMADAAGKAGNIKPESTVGQMLSGAAK